MNGEFDFRVCPVCGSGRIEEEGADFEPVVSPYEMVTASSVRCRCGSCSCVFRKTVMKKFDADRFEFTLRVSGRIPKLMKKDEQPVPKVSFPRRDRKQETVTNEPGEASQ